MRLDQLLAALEVTEIAAVQNQYSPLRTTWDPVPPEECALVLAECARRGIAYLGYSPLRTDGAPVADVHPAIIGSLSPEATVLAEILATSPAMGVISGASRPATVRDALTALT